MKDRLRSLSRNNLHLGSQSTSLLRTLGAATQEGVVNGSTGIQAFKALYLGGTLGKTFGAALTGSLCTIALPCASIILRVIGPWRVPG